MKKVDFVGKTWNLPDWANYITQDTNSNGAIVCWEKLPVLCNSEFKQDTKDWLNPGECKLLGHVKPMPNMMAV